MYLYYFNSKHGTCTDVYVFEVESYRNIKLRGPYNLGIHVVYDVTKCLNRDASNLSSYKHKKHRTVSIMEGEVMRRGFWLETYDLKEANEIIKNYIEQKQKEIEKKYGKYFED